MKEIIHLLSKADLKGWHNREIERQSNKEAEEQRAEGQKGKGTK